MAALQGDIGLFPVRFATGGAATPDGLAPVVNHPDLVYFHLEDRLDGPLDRVLGRALCHAESEDLAVAPDGLLVFAVADIHRALFFHLKRLFRDHGRFEHVPNRICHNVHPLLAQFILQGVNRIFGENNLLIVEHVVNVDVNSGGDLNPGNIA